MGENLPPESKGRPAAQLERAPRRAEAPAGEGDRQLRAAIDASARTGSVLSELGKTIAELFKGLSGATHVNQALVQELSALGALLGEIDPHEPARTSERLAQLERDRSASREAIERERELVTQQQDEFIAALIEEHEAALHGRDGDARALLKALDDLDETRSQRDEAQGRAAQLERERDELRAVVSQLRASLGSSHGPSTLPPPQRPPSRPPSFGTSPALRLDEGELDTALHGRSLSPAPPPTASMFPRESTRPGVGGPKPSQAPPASWTAPPPAIIQSPWPVSAASLPPEAAPLLPILKRKPDPKTRPLVDYSLGEGGVASETLEGAKLSTKSSKPPRK